MDHEEAVRQKAAEKYLLGELDPEERDEFEDHFFDCQDCAIDVRTTAMFVEQSKAVFSQPEKTVVRVPVPVTEKAGWLTWFRPAFAIPALAALLAVIGYQNLVTVPQLSRVVHRPEFATYASLNLGTRGTGSPISVRSGEDLVLSINVPPEHRYSSYFLDLYNAAGNREWSLTVPQELAASSDDSWTVKVPTAGSKEGNYTLVVRGTAATGESAEVGRTQFTVQPSR